MGSAGEWTRSKGGPPPTDKRQHPLRPAAPSATDPPPQSRLSVRAEFLSSLLRSGCKVSEDCGKCNACLDKPKFGGENKLKQACKMRRCVSLVQRVLDEGVRVKARWSVDNAFYPGVISRVNLDGTCWVTFDDGDTEPSVMPKDIRLEGAGKRKHRHGDGDGESYDIDEGSEQATRKARTLSPETNASPEETPMETTAMTPAEIRAEYLDAWWMQSLARLEAFAKGHKGDCNVGAKTNPKLYSWVCNQKREYKKYHTHKGIINTVKISSTMYGHFDCQLTSRNQFPVFIKFPGFIWYILCIGDSA